MFESGRQKAGARRGAQRPVDVGFAPTEAKRRYEPVRVRQDSFNIERGYPLGYPLSILRRARDGTRTRDPDLGKVVLHQLSHSRIINKIFISKQVMGIEPTYSAWKADVLPLNHTCISCCVQKPINIDRGDRIRTCDLLVPNQAL